MSVIHKKSNGGASTEIEKEVREVKAAGEQTAALLVYRKPRHSGGVENSLSDEQNSLMC